MKIADTYTYNREIFSCMYYAYIDTHMIIFYAACTILYLFLLIHFYPQTLKDVIIVPVKLYHHYVKNVNLQIRVNKFEVSLHSIFYLHDFSSLRPPKLNILHSIGN